MTVDDNKKRKLIGFRVLVTIASFFVVVAGMKTAASIMLPILFAFFLAIIGTSVVQFLQRYKLPKFISITIVTLLVISVLVILCLLLIRSVNEFTIAMPRYQQRFLDLTLGYLNQLESYGIDISKEKIAESFQAGTLVTFLSSTVKGLANAVSKVVVVLIIMVFMMVEAADFRKKLNLALKRNMNIAQLENISIEVQRYMGIKTVTSALTGLIVYVFVSFMQVDFAILWGIVAFFMNFIPFVGSILASIPAILLALVQFDAFTATIVGIGYLIINIGISNFIEPILMGKQFGLSPLVVFLSLMIWGWIWGPVGMLLAVPLTMMLKIFLEHSRDLRWCAILMGSKPKLISQE